jgi:biopolymer transport protein TolR
MPAVLERAAGRSCEINVTPLIDVLLVLLVVFFVINVLRLRLVQDLPLPSPVSESPQRGSSQLVLELRSDGSFALNQQPVPAAALQDYLREVLAGRPSKLLFLRADSSRTYQEVIDAMDLARGVGAEGIALVPVARRPRRAPVAPHSTRPDRSRAPSLHPAKEGRSLR